MKEARYTFTIPDDMDIESVVIHLQHKEKADKQYRRGKDQKIVTLHPPRYDEHEDFDEGLLYDDLY